MVSVTKKTINGSDYYYLSFSYRKEGEMNLEEKYVGTDEPDPSKLEKMKEQFMLEVAEKLWLPDVEKMKANYERRLESLPETIKAKDLRSFGIRFTHHSNKIEGSSLKQRDVKVILEDNVVPKNKSTIEVIETKSHMAVYEQMINCKEALTLELLLDWHDDVFSLTKPEVAGMLREYQVFISGSDHVPPPGGTKMIEMLYDLFDWYKEVKKTMHPVSLACLMHFYFISIHPFGDGNGRITRLMTNYILFNAGYPMFDIDPKWRAGYYRALEDSNVKQDPSIFIAWFYRHYLTENERYI